MKSFSYLALVSALAVSEAAILPDNTNGIHITIPKVPMQNDFPQTGPTLAPMGPPGANNKTYEYIVIGSGAGGAPLAADLAVAGHSVLLIEAGGDFGRLREVESPAFANPASERNEVSWGFFTHHYSNETQALRDRKLTWLTPAGDFYSGLSPPEGSTKLGNFYPRLGGLGGCSEHNALVGVLPAVSDWSNIEEITGDSNWSSEHMRDLWKGIENLGYNIDEADADDHGYDGWLKMAQNPLGIAAQDVKLVSVLIGAAKAVGLNTDTVSEAVEAAAGLFASTVGEVTEALLPLNMTEGISSALNQLLEWDVNRDFPERDATPVLAKLPMSMDNVNYRRSSPRDYVYDVATATNPDGSKKYALDVALHTLATKVTFDTTGELPKANGVDYLYGQSLYRADPRASLTEDTGIAGSVKATREIIVSGGTFNTPQILKLSGVGPREELESFDIPVIVDLPGVGTNLQDRIETGVAADATSNFTRILDCTYLYTEDDPCWSDYANPDNKDAEKGNYASNGVVMGYFGKSSVSESHSFGNVDIWLGGFPALFSGFFPGYSSNAATPDAKNHFSWLVLKAHTGNRGGTVKLLSTNPRDTPLIEFHNLYEGQSPDSAAGDVQAMVEGMKIAFSFFDNINAVDGSTFERIWPPQEIDSDEDLAQWVQDESWGHHASCSVPIGADDNPMAALDGQLRVRGTEGLRVVDASIFPRIPGTFPATAIYMAAAKARDDILAAARA